MGQSSSTPASPQTKLKRAPKPPPPPPKTPNYVIPENKVIPNGVGDMENARKFLRPVSQELTKLHPDFADIFHYDQAEMDFLVGGDDSSLDRSLDGLSSDKENSFSGASNSANNLKQLSANRVNLNPDPYLGHNGNLIYDSNNYTAYNNNKNNTMSSSRSAADLTESTKSKESNLKRSHSLERDRSLSQPRYIGHRRQSSFSIGSNSSQPQPVIPEDPREHLYNVARQTPFSNLIPANASLPLKNSFDSDYSLNLTYAQLAEYRRQKRNMELESKTGQRLRELGDEIRITNNVPKSPFDRYNLGARSYTASISTGSSEVGVSKSKKKKAPPPPPPPPNPEPPVDYDSQNAIKKASGTALKRTNSSAAGSNKPPPPPTLPKTTSLSALNRVERNTVAAKAAEAAPTPEISSQPNLSPSSPSALIPPAPPLPSNFMSKTTTTSNALSKPETNIQPQALTSNTIPGYIGLQESKNDAKAQLEMLKNMLKAPVQGVSNTNPKQENDSDNGAKQNTEQTAGATTVADNLTSDENNNVDEIRDAKNGETSLATAKDKINADVNDGANGVKKESSDSPNNMRRMSTLLQHDIVLAAQGHGAKQKKKKQPPLLQKPKDPADVFREELAKAAKAREDRRSEYLERSSPSADLKLNEATSDDSSASKEDSQTEQEKNSLSQPSIESKNDVVDFSATNNIDKNRSRQRVPESLNSVVNQPGKEINDSRRSSASCENMSISSTSSHRVFSSAWTPEHDLEPDDDIMSDARTNNNGDSSETHGFKSSMVPTKVEDWKGNNKSKKFKKTKPEKQKPTDQIKSSKSSDDKAKFGNIRKFGKSVQENMKNAFGSISRASGKLLKKNKSQDFLNSSLDSRPKAVHVFPAGASDDLDGKGNWELMEAGTDVPMRRVRSEEMMNLSLLNGNGIYEDEGLSSDESDEDVADIDFSTGMEEDEMHGKDSKRKSEKMSKSAVASKMKSRNSVTFKSDDITSDRSVVRQMKRAGVAYVSGKGQIIVLPEYNTVNVDADGNEIGDSKDDEGRAPKLFKKKDKKLKFESTVRVTEKQRQREILAREIREKEQQIERERVRQQEIEQGFRRLRDLDTQERLQRLQTDNILQQLSYLQQQQVHQQHLDLNMQAAYSNGQSVPHPFNTAGVSMPSSSGHATVSSQYPHNIANSFITVSNVPQPQPHTTSFPGSLNQTTSNNTPSHHPNTSHFSTNYLNNTIAQLPKMAPTVNATHYTTHTAPIFGNNTPTNTASFPNLSAQDLNHLSEYMRMVGVAPPTTQQQWAFLLSSVSFNTPAGFPIASQVRNSVSTPTFGGPDLTQLFGMGKTIGSTIATAPTSAANDPFYNKTPFDAMGANGDLKNINSSNNFSTDAFGASARLVELDQSSMSTGDSSQQSPVNVKLTSDNDDQQDATASELTTSTESESSGNTDSAEDRLDSLAASLASNPPTTSSVDNSTMNMNGVSGEKDAGVTTHGGKSMVNGGSKKDYKNKSRSKGNGAVPRLEPKVYGPIGFKSISFKAGAAT